MFKCFFLLLGLLMSSVSLAADTAYGLTKHYLVDKTSSMQIEDVQNQTLTPYQNDLNLGFQDGVVWLRLDIQPRTQRHQMAVDVTAKTSPVILRMGPYVLDSAVLYQPQAGGWLVQSLGDRTSGNQSMCPDGLHCFALQNPPDEPVTVFVKVKQRGIFTVHAEVVAWEDLPTVVANGSGKNAAALAVSISLLLLGIALLVVERSTLLLVFCCFEVVVVLLIAATTGVLAHHLPFMNPSSLDALTHHLFNLRVVVFVLVSWALMVNYHPNQHYKRVILFLMLVSLLSSVLISIGEIKWAIVLYLAVTGINPVLQIYALLVTGGISKKVRALLGVSYCAYFLVFVNALLNLFPDLLPARPLSSINSFADWRINGGPAGLVVFLFVIIHNAEKKLADSKALGQLTLQAAQSVANAEKLSERQTLIDMLTHELKNPLGTMRFALASLKRQVFDDEDTLLRIKRMDKSVERMNDLIEQVAGSNKIDRFELTDSLEMIDAAELIQEFISDATADHRFQLHIQQGAQFHSHRRMLSLIIENLIANAVKYGEPLQDICIHVDAQDQYTLFQISNHVLSSHLPDPSKLFKRYYRHDSVQALPGLGIGLSLVQTAAEKIGAQVNFSIEQNTVTFTLKVPS